MTTPTEPEDTRTSDVLEQIDQVAVHLSTTADLLDDAIRRFERIAPRVEHLLEDGGAER